MLSSFFATRSAVVDAGLTPSLTDTPPLVGMGDAPLRLLSGPAWALRWNECVSATQVGTYTVSVVADDGVVERARKRKDVNATQERHLSRCRAVGFCQ